MAIMKIEYHSEALDMSRQVNVIYPDRNRIPNPDDKDIPVLYLLHGMGGNQDSWLNRSTIERLVRYTNLIVVMVNTDKGWYTNTTYGMNYYDAIAIELPQVLKRFFPNMSDKREKNFIAGLSMGGYGAFKIALSTNCFSYAASLSGALSFDFDNEGTADLGNLAYWTGVFGDIHNAKNPNNLTEIAKQSDKKTKFYAWCGEEDFLFAGHEKAIADLKKMGLDIEASKGPGKHEWYYWNQQIEYVLQWLPIDFELEERLS
ncbi:alpha/beta hydrolase [Streptococcus suis]